MTHLPFCCRISISRSPASPRTNCDTPAVGGLLDAIGRAVVEDLRLVGPQPRQGIKHHHAVGHLLRRAHVVGHHHAGDRVLAARAEDQLVDHVAHDRVQPGRGLVVEDDLRLQGQGPGQSHPFSHAAGKLGRLLAQDVLRQAHLGQPGQDHPPDLLRRLAGVLPQGGKATFWAIVMLSNKRRLLEQETEANPLPGQLPLAQFGQVPAVEMDRAAGWAAAAR